MLQKLNNINFRNHIFIDVIEKKEPTIFMQFQYNIEETIYTDVAELSYDRVNSLVHIKLLENITINVEKAQRLIQTIKKITEGKKHYTLIDATNYIFIDDDALKYMASPEACADKLGSAYYSINLANRLTMHFFKVFHKPSYPVELFKKKEEAVNWIKQTRIN
ncbi:MAG: hypothetical protein V4565_09510 [Bacteroidota bacterium]